ncbi:hypothetical protein H0H81_004014 [Sphagnurus paluster]|uniref:Uncharacterized protein n=1 Tax=Sphagnurus paluster TaxID=117069 RepID=A0A9P7GMD9_9AGAR|nr:hypothetical protein H0H81_004014 [Sphagnurus paluster]
MRNKTWLNVPPSGKNLAHASKGVLKIFRLVLKTIAPYANIEGDDMHYVSIWSCHTRKDKYRSDVFLRLATMKLEDGQSAAKRKASSAR